MTVSGRQPKQWDQIFQHLQQEIEAGWPADTAFWSAEDLHERFQISIGMANRILQELELGGWLYAVQGIRERRVVGKRHVSDRSTEFLRDPAWKRPWIKTIDAAIEDQPPDWVQAIRGPGPAWRWKSYQGDGIVTLAIADGWYDVDSPAVLLEKKPDRPFYRLLETHYGLLAGFEETVSARLATFEERDAFHVVGRAPLMVLQIDRVTRTRSGQVVEVVRLVDRASHYQLRYDVPYRQL
ncbi:MAG: GntR family transcriptional regulator [Sulfobacillus thermosulfidooxidans]|uniref:DNA-binding transcriptional regulator, GntR family n=1 Tax=Sulfobacillus thermosulfidooxidans (strain DSM 9293 / VKM B-1269 / AT-1) TaxID=929705 RepID=A0A1W1WPH9_SULTA|nr:GntR family transcriptional regulator [Sulfobacillus thermosulfidooxidans]PSR32654.1 MAG: GntR family transcriptional regulator [Sulfobacillus thermosulfidooxidans]SMC08211.1 DNA-binding transcriptional regulator, GntR family [Sulfobacillus thermosulfidooxidans DSM 9293]